MNFIFLMDPLENIIVEKDTSYILMLGAHRRGHNVFYLTDGGIVLKENKAFFHVLSVIPQQNTKQPFIIKNSVVLSQDQVHAVFVRSDPPFDAAYLLNTQLLERLPKKIPVINSPEGLRTAHEKIWATQFAQIIPKTFLGVRKKDLLGFIEEEKDVIAKPTNGFGGSGIFHIKKGDDNTNVILETMTNRWKTEVILQKYLPAAKKGDKRILLLNGEPLGAVLRVHAKDDHRNNFFAGGKPHPASITENDKKIIQVLKPHLLRLGLYFVGIDIIGNFLIEVNVTSPTCLQEMNRLYGKKLEEEVIRFAEKLILKKRK